MDGGMWNQKTFKRRHEFLQNGWNQKQQGKKSTHKTGRHLWTDSFLVMFPIHPPTHEKPRSRKINTYHSFYNRVGEYDQFRYVF